VALARWVGRAIGLDVHREFCVVAICEDGDVRSAGRVPSTPEDAVQPQPGRVQPRGEPGRSRACCPEHDQPRVAGVRAGCGCMWVQLREAPASNTVMCSIWEG
jgi:hypothetical protein